MIVFNYKSPIGVGIESSIETIGAWYQVKVINRSWLHLNKNKKKITLPRSTLIRMVQYFGGQLVLEFIGTAAISYKINIDLIYCKASHPFILRIQNTMSFSFTTSIIFKYFRSHAFCILPNSSFMIVWVVRHFCLFVHRQRNASRAK